MTGRVALAISIGAGILLTGSSLPAQVPDIGQAQVPVTQRMGIDQKLGAKIPIDVPFKDELGHTVLFGDLFHGRPILLLPIFYGCKTGCALITDGLVQTLSKATKGDTLKPGRDFDVEMLSINPKETPELALAKKNFIFDELTPAHGGVIDETWRAQASKGWHLLTGTLPNIHRITDAVGFRYSYDPVKDLVNHPTCSVILTPTGLVSGYTIGNDFPTRILESDFGLAVQNRIGEKADQSFMFGCIMLDPSTGKYRFVVENLVRAGCVLTLLIMVFSIVSMSLKSKRAELQGGERNTPA